MTYIVFALIVAAALFYLIFSDSRAVRRRPARLENNPWIERRDAIKLSLRDLEYEKTVGKMDADNFNRLQNELLTEWDAIETKLEAMQKETELQPSAAAVCGQCGAEVVAAAAKFCHACGARLAGLIFAVCLFFIGANSGIEAFDIRVTVQNGTANRIETAPLSVQLLKLEQGMQPVTAQNTTAGKVAFLNLPEMTQGPYMVQAVYRGVTYSRVIPPNMTTPAEVTLEIFDSTASQEKIRVRTLIEIRRVEKNALAGLMILFFVNSGKTAFAPGQDGLEFYLPPGAVIDQASISVGTGASNIQWLKLTPKAAAKSGFYTVGQNVKPGDRIMQVIFHLPYDEKGTSLNFQTLYPQDTGIQVIAEPENLEVKQGDKVMSRVRDENLGRGLISFTARETQVSLTLTGGGIAEIKKNEEAAELEIKSPLSLWQKIVFPLVALAIFSGALWLKSRRKEASL